MARYLKQLIRTTLGLMVGLTAGFAVYVLGNSFSQEWGQTKSEIKVFLFFVPFASFFLAFFVEAALFAKNKVVELAETGSPLRRGARLVFGYKAALRLFYASLAIPLLLIGTFIPFKTHTDDWVSRLFVIGFVVIILFMGFALARRAVYQIVIEQNHLIFRSFWLFRVSRSLETLNKIELDEDGCVTLSFGQHRSLEIPRGLQGMNQLREILNLELEKNKNA